MSNVVKIVAVHGTFARGATWAQEHSIFHRNIEAALAPKPVEWLPFAWSGRNSHAERERAARQLSKYIISLRLRDSETVFLLSHSHGGNIALMTGRDKDTRDHIAGIITMATPFIAAVAKPEQAVSMGVRYLFVLVMYLGIALSVTSAIFSFSVFNSFTASLFAFLITAALIIVILNKLHNIRPHTFQNEIQRIIETYTAPLGSSLLSLKVDGDEAYKLLHYGDRASRLAATLAFTMHAIAWTPALALAFIVWGTLPAVLLLALAVWGLNLSAGIATILIEYALKSAPLLLGCIFISNIFNGGIFLLRSIARASPLLWGESLRIGLLVRFEACTVPPQSEFVEDIYISLRKAGSAFALNHSRIYTEEETVTTIASFIRRQMSQSAN